MSKKNSIVPVQWSPRKGGLKSDVDPKNLQNGDLYVTDVDTGALNVRSVGKGTNVSPDYEPIGGNTQLYNIPAAIAQNKRFTLELVIADTTNTSVNFSCNLQVKTASGNEVVTPISSINLPPPTPFTAEEVLLVVEAYIQAEHAILSPTTSIYVFNSNLAYLDVEYTSVNYMDWDLINILPVPDNYFFTIKTVAEPIDRSMSNQWHDIGSDDSPGDCFQFWTTRKGLPVDVPIFGVSSSGTVATITTVLPHNISDGFGVRISGVVGSIEVNGEWITQNVTPTTFDIEVFQPISAYIGSGTISYNIYGLGEIGVVVEDDAGTITYTRLLRSREFNFSTKRQVDVRVKRKQDSRIAAYFTQEGEVPKVFYYKGPYVQDGALNTVISDNIYEYGSIASELKWIVSDAGFGVSFIDQAQGGGALYSGNWRYAIRWLTANFATSEWSPLTNPVPVFSYDYTSGPFTIGDVENTVTPKINVLEMANVIPGIFTYAEIAAVNYIGSSLQAYIIGRYVLDGTTTQRVSHTGNESGLIDLDAGQLNQTFPGFIYAKNVELIDNRAVLTNLTPTRVIDFSDWVQTFRYSLEIDRLTPVGVYTISSATLTTGEYQEPMTVHTKMTHMPLETYRYGFMFKLKNGRSTDVFYYDDITIDLPTTLPTKRDSGSFTTYDLTDDNGGSNPTEVYSVYIDFHNIDLSFKIDGVPVIDLVEEIIPVRAPVVPEVLAMGLGVLGVAGVLSTGSYDMWYTDVTSGTLANSYTGPFPYFMGHGLPAGIYGGPTGIVSSATPIYPDNWQNLFPSGEAPRSVFLYAPDIVWNHTSIINRAGDKLYVLGAPARHNQYNTGPGLFAGGPNGWDGSYAEYNGATGHTSTPAPYDVNDSVYAPRGIGRIRVDGNDHSLNLVFGDNISTPIDPEKQFPGERCQITVVSSNITNPTANTNYGAMLMIYFRPLTDKYGDPSNTKYEPIGVKLSTEGLSGTIGSGNLKAYGDCFNQKTYLKQRYPGWDGFWFGGGVGFYSVNRINTQLKRKTSDAYDDSDIVPEYFIGDSTNNSDQWLKGPYTTPGPVVNQEVDPQLGLNEGYTPRNDIQYYPGFNENLQYQTDWGNAIAWSDPEVEGSNSDNLRNFPPLNIKFLDYTQGPITDARELNGELITIQPREVQRQYFNTTSMINTTDGSEVVLGDGSVLQRRGQTMTKFGSQHKWSVIMGRSDRGHDTLYGIDDINKAVWRIGYDGTSSLDEINGMKAFIANNLRWIRGKYTPADGDGIRGVANQRYREVLWTLTGSAAGSVVAPEWQQNVISGNLLQPFESNLGPNLVQNPLFSGDTATPAVIPGWTAAVGSPFGFRLWTGTGVQSVHRSAALGTNDIIEQTSGITFTTGATYLVKIHITSTNPNPLFPVPVGVKFEAGPQYFTANTAGVYYFLYTATATANNIYIYGPAASDVRIQEASVWEVTSTANWIGSPDWLLNPTGATCIGPTVNLEMAVPPQVSLVSGVQHTLAITVTGCTAGGVVPNIGNQPQTAITADGSYMFTATPTDPSPIISFAQYGGFNGTITQSIYCYSTTPKSYVIGDIVSVFEPSLYGPYKLYIATQNNSDKYPPDFSDPNLGPDQYWAVIPTTASDYYTMYTLVFSETKNEFQAFWTPRALIYNKFLDKYLVPRPFNDTGSVYLPDSGTHGVWFDDGLTRVEGDAFFDAVINAPEGRKSFVAIRVESDSAPDRVSVFTNQHETYMLAADFEQREGNEFDSPVLNDILTAPGGTPTEDTTTLYGDYAIFRFITFSGAYNKFNSFISKVRDRARQFMR